MNMTNTLRASPAGPHDAALRRDPAAAAVVAVGIGLWVFIGVATALFLLFITAYVMRMNGADWSAIAMPWQLWLSTALLMAGSITLQRSAAAAQGAHWERARSLLLLGGACAVAFLGVQLWAWQAL